MGLIKRIASVVGGLLLMAVIFGAGWLFAKVGIGTAVEPSSLTELENQFRTRMQNTSLIGQFTVDGYDNPGGTSDRYDIAGVEKVGEDRWRFDVRMRHANVDVTLPVAVPMVWVGDTPIIMMSDFNIPGIGAFTARVFFHGDRYAGTWESSAAGVGGLMYGSIESTNDNDPDESKADEAP